MPGVVKSISCSSGDEVWEGHSPSLAFDKLVPSSPCMAPSCLCCLDTCACSPPSSLVFGVHVHAPITSQVEAGQEVVVLEAMKMQMPLFAPKTGKVCTPATWLPRHLPPLTANSH